MKRRKVLKELDISISTLKRYVANGKLTVTKLPSGQLDYDEESVMEFKNGGQPRQVVLYCRASPISQSLNKRKQNRDLKSQEKELIAYLKEASKQDDLDNSITLKEIASTHHLSHASKITELLKSIMNYEVKKMYATSSDRIPYCIVEIFDSFCARYSVDIEFIDNDKTYEEISDEESESEIDLLERYHNSNINKEDK